MTSYRAQHAGQRINRFLRGHEVPDGVDPKNYARKALEGVSSFQLAHSSIVFYDDVYGEYTPIGFTRDELTRRGFEFCPGITDGEEGIDVYAFLNLEGSQLAMKREGGVYFPHGFKGGSWDQFYDSLTIGSFLGSANSLEEVMRVCFTNTN